MTSIQFGEQIYDWPLSAELLGEIHELLEVEEQRILLLRRFLPGVEEYILIHFVRMYLFRFAVAAVEIQQRGLDRSATTLDRVREQLWLCFLGRALDDIVDDDSRFFSRADAAILLTAYHRLLGAQAPEPLLQSMTAAGRPSTELPASTELGAFDALKADVCRRVDYFLLPARRNYPERVSYLETYVALLLGRSDLDDVLMDRTGRQATGLSLSLFATLADEEGKIKMRKALYRWHAGWCELLVRQAGDLRLQLEQEGLLYSACVLQREHELFSAQIY